MESAERVFQLNREQYLWAYALVACPEREVMERIMEEKKDFQERYGSRKELTRPHILIASFQAREAMEDILVRWIQNVCNLQNSFSVTLNNYSSFPPHTIYMRVQDPKPFHLLASGLKILDGFICANDCPPVKLVKKPHLVIAEDLTEAGYTEAVKDYAHKTCCETFRVEKLQLLKLVTGGTSKVVNTFTLPSSLLQ